MSYAHPKVNLYINHYLRPIGPITPIISIKPEYLNPHHQKNIFKIFVFSLTTYLHSS